jgi:hypothetical protein
MTPAGRIRSDADELAPTPDPVVLAHAAASAVTHLCSVLDDCAREVGDPGGQRTARWHLMPLARSAAFKALDGLANTLPPRSPARDEVLEIMAAVVGGYVRPAMAMRVVAIATEARR